MLIDADYNDLGFSVGNRLMVLVECQSTWIANIIIRALMYLMQTYHDYFKRTNQNLYGSKKVNMSKPELYMIYTGDRKTVPNAISLSNEFFNGETVAIDAKIREDPMGNSIEYYLSKGFDRKMAEYYAAVGTL